MGRTSCASYVDKDLIAMLIERHSLFQVGMSSFIYGGSCPFCGHEKSFTVWADKGNFRCFYCGCDGRFVRTPERLAHLREESAKKAEGQNSSLNLKGV